MKIKPHQLTALSTKPCIEADVTAGADHVTVFKEAQALADSTGIDVHFSFKDIPIIAAPGGWAKEIHDEWIEEHTFRASSVCA